jgi:hypothetical protein
MAVAEVRALREGGEAALWRGQIERDEDAEAEAEARERERMPTECVGVKRLMKLRHKDMEYALETDTGVVGQARKRERRVLENVERKIHVRGKGIWRRRRRARMNDIRKNIRNRPIVIPTGKCDRYER